MGWDEEGKAAGDLSKYSCLVIKIPAFIVSFGEFSFKNSFFFFFFGCDPSGEPCFSVSFWWLTWNLRTCEVFSFLFFIFGKKNEILFVVLLGFGPFGFGLKMHASDALRVGGFWVFALSLGSWMNREFWFCEGGVYLGGLDSSSLIIR